MMLFICRELGDVGQAKEFEGTSDKMLFPCRTCEESDGGGNVTAEVSTLPDFCSSEDIWNEWPGTCNDTQVFQVQFQQQLCP